ncbi:site-specific DNA-methyltransferase [Campylobacter sp.]|uniref:DNA-methyltransferase n=1 Tax=Campylobacter sp. TaxID=205 RepID=UPI002A74ECC9|nr:site-specific DNA-methyltransferase [Campylobacter sp.]MDY3245267.1 site-specific DNA-methyltransferase [Campylobacter sp.]
MLYHGDCYEVLKDKIANDSIDLVVTDPPYDLSGSLMGSGFMKKENKKCLDELKELKSTSFEPEPFLYLLQSKFKNGVFNGYFFCNKSLVARYINWAVKNGYNYDILVMSKANPVPIFNAHHLSDLEYILFIRSSGAFFNSKLESFDNYRKHYSVVLGNKNIHPAKKPLELIKRFVRVSSQAGGVVCDPFMGSGTTGVACRELGREFVGCEQDKKYFELAVKAVGESVDKRERGLFGEVWE